MASDNSSSAADPIGELVTAILAKHDVKDPVDADAELARLGLTSIDMVELMLSVEADFDITIPPEDITLENFRSIASIRRLVDRLRSMAERDAAA